MVAAAGVVLRREAKANALKAGLKNSGALIRNIAIKRESKAGSGTTQYNLGVKHGRDLGNGKKVIKFLAIGKSGRVVTKRQNDPFYWSFHELGTKYHKRVDFLANALKTSSQEAINAMKKRLSNDIAKAGK